MEIEIWHPDVINEVKRKLFRGWKSKITKIEISIDDTERAMMVVYAIRPNGTEFFKMYIIRIKKFSIDSVSVYIHMFKRKREYNTGRGPEEYIEHEITTYNL